VSREIEKCPGCGCKDLIRVDELKAGGGYGPSGNLRCAHCKNVFAALSEQSAPGQEEANYQRLLSKVSIAYGYLWHVNTEPMNPRGIYSPEKASYAARHILRDELTGEQRGKAINAVQMILGDEEQPAAPPVQQVVQQEAVAELRAMTQNYMDTWSREQALRAGVAKLKGELAEAVGLLKEAAYDVDDWGGYAGDYFKENHDLAGTVKGYLDAANRLAQPTEPAQQAGGGS